MSVIGQLPRACSRPARLPQFLVFTACQELWTSATSEDLEFAEQGVDACSIRSCVLPAFGYTGISAVKGFEI